MSLTQLSKLLPLPSEDLQQILDYAGTLSSNEVANHFYDLLGFSLGTTEFIEEFNKTSQRSNDNQKNTSSASSKNHDDASNSLTTKRSQKKKKKDSLPTRETRQVLDDTTHSGTRYYKKKDEENYMGFTKKVGPVDKKQSQNLTLLSKAPAQRVPSPSVTPGTPVSDSTYRQSDKAPHPLKASGSRSSSKSKNKTKINISGGKALHGESTIISELDAAIRALEISTNSKLNSQDSSRRACNCIGTRHPILTAAPNCLSCGKVICVIEGLGPCTFCGTPLLSSVEVQTMISHLREERGREKMIADNKSRKRAEVAASKPKPSFSTPQEHSSSSPHIGENQISSAEIQAQVHRDKLLGFQAQNAKRTTVHDEVADFNIDESEVRRDMLWATPVERANALKKQQKLRQEMEWQAKPAYEKRKVVVSLDVVKGKVVKQIRNSVQERVEEEPSLHTVNTVDDEAPDQSITSHSFRKNPLIGNLTRPIWSDKVGTNTEKDTGKDEKGSKWKINTWRRVLDDQDDNEDVILDGGLLGG